jgi:hypothetical protein
VNRKTRFIEPHGISHGKRRYFVAMIAGEWQEDENFAALHQRFTAAKAADQKAKRAARKVAKT